MGVNILIRCIIAWCLVSILPAAQSSSSASASQDKSANDETSGSDQSPTDGDIASRIKAYLRPFDETGNLIGTVLVARKGHVLFKQSYGMANYELHVPDSDETRYHIASVSKPFTAVAILQLQEQRRLSVSDHVSKYVPDFPNGDQITLDQLLTHSSGIPDINGLEDYDTFVRSPHTIDQLVAKFAGLPLEFAPGSKQRYSNSNDILLALILEKVSGESFEDYLRKHIFEPAGMHDSAVDSDASRLIPLAASGYNPAGISGFDNAPHIDWSNKMGSGSLYSTVEDLYRFDRALNTDALLKRTTQQKYFVEGDDNVYGWYTWNSRLGHRLLAAKGHGAGFTAELDRFPDDDVTIIVLSNSYGTGSQHPITDALAAMVFGQQLPPNLPLRAVTVPETLLASYAGHYQWGPDFSNEKFTLSAKPGFLLMQTEEQRGPLVPTSPTEFLERKFFGRVVMLKDVEGKVSGLTCRYGDKTYTARRLDVK
jgi:CubicO group peptidase (beta-lactamase class C family)